MSSIGGNHQCSIYIEMKLRIQILDGPKRGDPLRITHLKKHKLAKYVDWTLPISEIDWILRSFS